MVKQKTSTANLVACQAINLNSSSVYFKTYLLLWNDTKPVTAPRLEVPGIEVREDVPETGAEADIATAMEPRWATAGAVGAEAPDWPTGPETRTGSWTPPPTTAWITDIKYWQNIKILNCLPETLFVAVHPGHLQLQQFLMSSSQLKLCQALLDQPGLWLAPPHSLAENKIASFKTDYFLGNPYVILQQESLVSGRM